MRQVGFGSCAGFIDDLTQPAAAKLLHLADRQPDDLFHHLQAQIGGNAKGTFVRAHQSPDVDQYRRYGKQHCHPAIAHQLLRTVKIRRDRQHFLHDLPDIVERHQCDERTDCRKHPGCVDQISVIACNLQQA